jgi:hypothetical protein
VGYVHEPATYRLTFDDKPGLEVRAMSVTVGEFMGFTGGDALGGITLAEETPGVPDKLLAAFLGALVSWTLEDKAGPVPATADGVRTQDVALVRVIVKGWLEAISGVSRPLRNGSSSTPSSDLEQSIPMESLSASQPS